MIHLDGIVFSLQRAGGISVYFKQLLKLLHELQLPHTLSTDGDLQQNLLEDLPSLEQVMVKRQARLLERYRRCRPVPAATNNWVFHSSYYRPPAAPDTPTIVTVHDFVYEMFTSGPRRWVHSDQKNSAIRQAQAIICISEATKQDLLKFVGVQNGQSVHVIHNGVADTFTPLEFAPSMMAPPYMLYVGERRGYKNFRLLLQAMEFLPGLQLHCVGGGALREDDFVGIAPAIRERVKHLGFVTDEALNEHYNRAFCLVYPSAYEGFGIPVAEAMKAGCPVVSIDCKAVREVGGAALSVAQAAEPRALAQAVQWLEVHEHRAQAVALGLQLGQQYSWRLAHANTLQVYKSTGADIPSHVLSHAFNLARPSAEAVSAVVPDTPPTIH